jgi:hypothetical protein
MRGIFTMIVTVACGVMARSLVKFTDILKATATSSIIYLMMEAAWVYV